MNSMSRDKFYNLKALEQSNITVYEKIKTEIDTETGELLSEKKEIIHKKSKEPDYIKLYYETMLAFNEINNIPIAFVTSLSKFLEWSNDGQPMCVTINKRGKEILQADCNVKLAQINRYIANSVKYGLLFRTNYKGVYEVNPFMIAKGRWESIRDLRCKFNFIDGKWIREIEEKSSDDKI